MGQNEAIPNVDNASVVLTSISISVISLSLACGVVSPSPRSAGGRFSEDASVGAAGAGSYHGGTVREQPS